MPNSAIWYLLTYIMYAKILVRVRMRSCMAILSKLSNADNIKNEIKTTATVIKCELKYSPMSEGNTCKEEPNLEV